MKPTQTVLLLLGVVALIFGVTFASMYVGKSGRTTPTPRKHTGGSDNLHLSFERTVYPENGNDPDQVIVTEYGKKGRQDFWFTNPNDEEVRLGLTGKTCECSDVRAMLAPDGWRSQLVASPAAELGFVGQNPLAAALFATGRVFDGVRHRKADEFTSLSELSTDGMSVPPRGLGFVRVEWDARRKGDPGPRLETLKVRVWMQDAKRPPAELVVGVILVDGLRLDEADLNVGVLGGNDTVRRVIRCWSNTREDFDLEVVSTAAPFIFCGPRERLTDEDRAELQRRGKGVVRSGYRYPVTIRVRAEDGTPFDTGVFSHRLTFKPREYVNWTSPLEVPIRGLVRGDVILAGTEQGIVMALFQVRDGATARATLYTERKGLSLKVDRVPDFMTVKLEQPVQEGGRTTWVLSVHIAPNKVSGAFPRSDGALSDTAIYLKVEGADRRLRIPVSGRALQ